MNTARFTIDFFNNSIIGTKASFNKASKGKGAEYEELASKISAHPDFKLVIKEQKHKTTKKKRTYDGLNFSFMRSYILTCDNADALLKDYEEVKKIAKASGTKSYPLTKQWFLREFGTEEKPFDMDCAREAISAYRIEQAHKNAINALSVVSSTVPAEQGLEDVA